MISKRPWPFLTIALMAWLPPLTQHSYGNGANGGPRRRDVWHFGKTIEDVLKLVGKYQILRNRTNPDALKQTRRLLQQKMPMREQVRHAIAHRSDFFTNPDSARNHSVLTPPGIRETRWGQLIGRRFRYTVNGMACYYDLNRDTLGSFVEIRSKFFAPFVKR